MDDRRISFELTQDTIFKNEFIISFKKKIHHANILEEQEVTYVPSWKDWAGFIGINTTASIINSGIIAGAVTSGLISAAVAPAIVIPIAITGLASYAGFVAYRLQAKRKEYQAVSSLFENRNIDDDIAGIAEKLYELYEENIDTLSGQSNRKFARILANTISYAMMKGKIKTVDDLFDGAKLHYLLILLANKTPKETLKILPNNDKLNARGYITKSAIHCKESDKTYIHDKTRLEKYRLTSLNSTKECKKFQRLASNKEYLQLDSSGTEYITTHSLFALNETGSNDTKLTQDGQYFRKKR